MFALGLRFRVEYRIDSLRRRTDIVFTRWKVAVFIDGCFWHACPIHSTVPKANRDWWVAKLQANVARDRDTNAQLLRLGWRVVRIWEHEPVEIGVPKVLHALREAGRPD